MIDISEFVHSEDAEDIAMREHIASGAKSEWGVYIHSKFTGTTYRYDNYDEANEKFNSVPSDQGATLVLYTRIGTSVLFRQKKLEGL